MITLESIRQNFPSLEGKCYLNTAAESIPPLAVGTALQQYWADKLLGMDGRDDHFAREEETRVNAAKLVGLSPAEVAFCSCSAEAYNLLATALRLQAEDEVVLSDLDFPSGSTPWLAAAEKPLVRLWQSRQGALELSDLPPLLSDKTRLVQVSLVSFYNGFRIPWQPFVEQVRRFAPNAILSVDLTQALGRCVLDCTNADILISSTHKWLLGIHGGCVVGVPKKSAQRLTTTAGGWYHIKNAFDADRFEMAVPKIGAASYSVGMPSFAPIYALNASMDFLLSVGVEKIAAYADPLVQKVHEGLLERGIAPLAPLTDSGIVAFKHAESSRIHEALRQHNVHLMHQAGRIRVAVHGYNTKDDIVQFLHILDEVLRA
jgi:cysteine desulfurase/selenocysteine lyase